MRRPEPPRFPRRDLFPRQSLFTAVDAPLVADEPPPLESSVEALLRPGEARPLGEHDVAEAAALIGCDVASLRAVIAVETSNDAFYRTGFPTIRPELHVFHRETDDAYAAAQFPTQAMDRFREMARLDAGAAIRSTSWGIGQVMGFNFRHAGCESPEQLVEEAKRSGADQLRHMVRFIQSCRLDGHLRAQDWARFARGYNGPDYARLDYAGKLARAYQRIAGAPAWIVLEFGAKGPAVLRLQKALGAAGLPCGEDGHYGPETEAAVREYQQRAGLEVDGVVGARTWTSLRSVLDLAEAKKDAATAPRAPLPADNSLDDLLKAGTGAGAAATGVGALTKLAGDFGPYLAAIAAVCVLALVGVYIGRKYWPGR